MKMITAIVNKKDAGSVCDALMQEGFFFTKMATTGGFLKAGNTTLLIGTDAIKRMLAPYAMHLCRKGSFLLRWLLRADF